MISALLNHQNFCLINQHGVQTEAGLPGPSTVSILGFKGRKERVECKEKTKGLTQPRLRITFPNLKSCCACLTQAHQSGNSWLGLFQFNHRVDISNVSAFPLFPPSFSTSGIFCALTHSSSLLKVTHSSSLLKVSDTAKNKIWQLKPFWNLYR